MLTLLIPTDVLLFGGWAQIAVAPPFAKHLAEHRTAQLVELLSSLRNDLRNELRLEHIEGPIVVLRPSFDNKGKK